MFFLVRNKNLKIPAFLQEFSTKLARFSKSARKACRYASFFASARESVKMPADLHLFELEELESVLSSLIAEG